ncbi:MAG: hypothetical protein CMJ42_14895 [Phyllobacteriaceae bacterium]|nr:hypothetical protein [Phyllobacteriaceae bacterium]
MKVLCYKHLARNLQFELSVPRLHLVSNNKLCLMNKRLTGINQNNVSDWVEKNTACMLVAFVPLQLGIAIFLNVFTQADIFPLSNLMLGICTTVLGAVLLAKVRIEKPNFKKKEYLVFAAAMLLLLQTAAEIASNGNHGAWVWLIWAYVTAVAAMSPSLLKSGALLFLTLLVTAAAIQFGQTPASPIQRVGSYLFFGTQSIWLCLLMLHFLRQQRSTVRRRYRQKLRKFNELTFFIENMSSPIFVKDDQNNLVYVNQAAARLFNSTRYQLVGKNLAEILPKKMATAMLKEDQEILSGKEMKPSIRKLSLPGLPEPQWFKISKKAYAFDHPRRRGVVVSVENIHEQIIFEEKLIQSENRFRTIFEKAPVGMMMVENCFSKFIEVNDALCNTLGYTREQLLSRSPADVSHPDDKLKALPMIDEAWENGQDFITLEKRFLHQSGRTIHALVALQLVRDSGKSSHLIGMVLDITDRKQYEERLKRKSSQLKQSNESLKEFAYAASHDLKQPLRTISSFTQLMLRYLPKEGTKPEVFEFAGHISEGVKRMETLINGLLEYSRVGNSQMNFETTNLVDVIITVCKNLGQQIQENKAEIDVVYPVPALAIDPLKFTSLLQNLISNAIKYRRPEVTPLIRLEVKEQEDHWLFSVQDNGKGIPEDQTENVFGLYKRLDTERDTEGTGIGLSLCRRIVSRHGGEIWIKSEYGKGSTFFFTISKHIGEMVNNTTPEEVL